MNFAIANAVANLANSAGCMRNGPITIHEREPFISCGLNIVANSNNSNTTYIAKAKVSYSLLSISNRHVASNKLVNIHTICIPERVSSENRSASSKE